MRCDTTLLRRGRFGGDVAIAFAATGGLLAVPAILLPLVEVSKFQATRESFVFSGARALWAAGMHLLAIWVFLCGLLVPVLLLGTLVGVLVPARLGRPERVPRFLLRAARAFESWALPEVHVLAVLVAFAKLGSLVHVRPGPGLWCYAAMAVCLLTAWHSFEFCHAPRLLTSGQRVAFDPA